MEWLNRLGIVLNFFAGFMLAPELIGLERLKIIENKIEGAFSRLITNTETNTQYNKSQNARMKLAGLSTIPFIGSTFISSPTITDVLDQNDFYRKRDSALITGFFFLFVLFQSFNYAMDKGIIWLGITTTGVFLWAIVLFFKGLGDFVNAIKGNMHKLSLLKWVLFFIFMTLLTPGVLLGLSVSAFFGWQQIPYTILRFQLSSLSYLLKILIGEQRLRSLLIFWGIIFFVLGNLLQLVATFG